ncbi:quinone oxidoreductase family protein [Ktedonospora formicarum]|uniref:NAD(P)H quinone oxidoreductase n=1 Tax=Ktedonospora formicarum TaxID=2778364 RepID=A0A8J3HZ07_9CHLR|nr:zinc-binding dehydrogenase [Ktedonospora formicarum]GHO43113.1 NAD(P)H quinone oxidoreductase [Ktedonospora formicarum]
MKAVQFASYGAPNVLQLRDVPDPIALAGQILLEVKATTVNHLDLFQRDGSRPVAQLPFTPGLEAAGIILANGHGFQAGERVLTTRALGALGGGGYASKIAAPISHLARIPDSVSFEQAAAAGLAASTAWGSLFTLGKLQAGERVLIWAGSSGVGSAAIQIAKQRGAWVATTTSSHERGEELRKLGADLVLNHRQQDVGQELQKLGGVQLVIELVSSTLQQSLEACAPNGRVVLIGNLGGKESTVDTQSWRLKRISVIGGGQLQASPQEEEQALQLIATKKFVPLIACALPIEQAAEAHALLESGEPQGKIVLLHS